MKTVNINNFSNAILTWEKQIGKVNVHYDRSILQQYSKDTRPNSKSARAVLYPGSIEDIQSILLTANTYKIPLYPISTGKNWGYGSACPVTENNVILNLSRMNRILDLDEALGVVTIEPGVTQKQLYDYLQEKKLRFMVPTTGAGPNVSLLGNAIERGYGLTPNSDHFGAVNSLKAILPNGEIYQSAFAGEGAFEADKNFKWGLGPYLDGIFTQGNMGIVTQITITLAPKPEKIEAFYIMFKEDVDPKSMVTAVRNTMKTLGSLVSGINLMNQNRILAMMESYPDERIKTSGKTPAVILQEMGREKGIPLWMGMGALYGNRKMIKAARAVVKEQFKTISKKVLFVNEKKLKIMEILSRPFSATHQRVKTMMLSLQNLSGCPNEAALKLAYWKSESKFAANADPSRDGCGIIWHAPIVPMKENLVQKYIGIVEKICRDHSMEPLITLSGISSSCYGSTIALLFNQKDLNAAENARNCYEALLETCLKEGFPPYRLGTQAMDKIINPDHGFWKLVSSIKKTIDPNNILAPGRYDAIAALEGQGYKKAVNY